MMFHWKRRPGGSATGERTGYFDNNHMRQPRDDQRVQEGPVVYASVSQPHGRGPVPGPCINYTRPREVLLELITNLNVILYLSTCHTVHINVLIHFIIMP